ncbi:hypothetical protein OIE62_07330 [Streptomyces scopuliridis]|uniref:Uncharacterized protein n=1 Tax=Streptomyces scopuliridis TaxID=452529 RepID=A0ACD4ZUI4_9ACTN|nr:hypothetical protein [Streptomyces scopuliridis]WSC01614.1 hypothetical protein OG835_34490 [Streptomyces scopuliridis]WSC04847.1 hypothetical protein OIE62_07330 [Streptomyces scopuliridis]
MMLIGSATHAQRQREMRRPAYLEFLICIEAALGTANPGAASLEEQRAVNRALDALVLIGPSDVVETAQRLASLVQPDHGRSPSEVERARTAFLTSARSALGTFSGDLSHG